MRNRKQQTHNDWLVMNSQQGDMAAFDALIRNWEKRYFLYAVNRLKDREAARDVTQECLLAISRSISTLADPAAFPKWSFRILERRCIDWLRKTIRDREFIQQQENLPEIAIEDGAIEKLSVEQLLAKLDSRLSTILRLYYLESLSIREIAEISNIPAGTVKSRLYYARKLMIKVMEA